LDSNPNISFQKHILHNIFPMNQLLEKYGDSRNKIPFFEIIYVSEDFIN